MTINPIATTATTGAACMMTDWIEIQSSGKRGDTPIHTLCHFLSIFQVPLAELRRPGVDIVVHYCLQLMLEKPTILFAVSYFFE